MKWTNLPFKLESELVRAWYRMTNGRPSSAPYLSGDGFRSWSAWKYEPETASRFDPSAVRAGSLGYCDGWLLEEFLKGAGRHIPVPFRLISHNADANLTVLRLKQLPPQLQRLYTTNALVTDSRVVPVPIGLENARFHCNGVVADFERLRNRPLTKEPRILTAFTVGTNPVVRGLALETLRGLDTVDMLSRVNSRTYRNRAIGYQFIASPPGNGEDCHRTWEACYLRAVPIVLRSTLTEFFVGLGLPLWVVDSYEELKAWDSTALDAKYRQLSPGFDHPALWTPYWDTLIKESRWSPA